MFACMKDTPIITFTAYLKHGEPLEWNCDTVASFECMLGKDGSLEIESTAIDPNFYHKIITNWTQIEAFRLIVSETLRQEDNSNIMKSFVLKVPIEKCSFGHTAATTEGNPVHWTFRITF